MQIGVLGTGMVGRTIAQKLADLNHSPMLGTRDIRKLTEGKEANTTQESFADWHAHNPKVKLGIFSEAAAYSEIVFNCINGTNSIAALSMAGADNLNGKILIDVSNSLDFSQGMPPTVNLPTAGSLGQQIQQSFPLVKVVKALNTVNRFLMVNPRQLADGEHHSFVCGNDPEAKTQVITYLKEWFGWRRVIDLGDITRARGPEMYVQLFVELWGVPGVEQMFNIRIVP